jgi:hypothetical protein
MLVNTAAVPLNRVHQRLAKQWVLAGAALLIAAVAVVAIVALLRGGTDRDLPTAFRAGSPVDGVAMNGVVGQWDLVRVTRLGSEIEVPAGSSAEIQFGDSRQYVADDGTNVTSGSFALTPGTSSAIIRFGAATSTLVGVRPGDKVAAAVDALVGISSNGTRTVELTTGPRQMVITAGDYRLVYAYVSEPRQPDSPAGSSSSR